MFQAYLVPGQGFKTFKVYTQGYAETKSGRPVENGYVKSKDTFLGMLTQASQKEIDQWKQNGHPITHKIIQYGGSTMAKATDCLKLSEDRCFYVQGRKNPADLGLTMIYYVEERLDLKEELI